MGIFDDIVDFFTGGSDTQQRHERKTFSDTRRDTARSTQAVETQQDRKTAETSVFRDTAETADEQTRRALDSSIAGTQRQLDEETVAIIQRLIPDLATGVTPGSDVANLAGAASRRATGIGDDIDEIVQLAQTGAERRFERDVEPGLQVVGNEIGGSASTNTITAQLTSDARERLNETLAGIEAQTRLEGARLEGEALTTATGVSQAGLQNLLGAVGAITGAEVTTEQATQTTELADTLRTILGSEDVRQLLTEDTDRVVSRQEQEQIMDLIEAVVQEAGTSLSETGGNFTNLVSALVGSGGINS